MIISRLLLMSCDESDQNWNCILYVLVLRQTILLKCHAQLYVARMCVCLHKYMFT